MKEVVRLVHGDGGVRTKCLIEDIFYKFFQNELLLEGQDAAVFPIDKGRLAYTTDSYVVNPFLFEGGNIGKLAACGTINDLVVSGAKPLYLSAGFIIEEGFPMDTLSYIAKSMGEVCKEAGVRIITGDTKVVDKGGVDGIFINTSGIGSMISEYRIKPIEAEDKIIVTGNIGDHGTTIAIERYQLKVKSAIQSDCASLYVFLEELKNHLSFIKIMRDPTRGGLATVLHEFSAMSRLGIRLMEDWIPIQESVRSVNEILGLDPLYMACEGRMVIVVDKKSAEDILRKIQSTEQGKDARIIGEFVSEPMNVVYSENSYGGKRIIPLLEESMLPRIC
jgi:hydrogenase expression/formation protein HypE